MILGKIGKTNPFHVDNFTQYSMQYGHIECGGYHWGKLKRATFFFYWYKNRVETLPRELWYIFFDMCVNMGRRTAVKVLQRAANNKGKDIDVDGGLGPATIGALKGVELDRVRAFRVKYYVDLITARPEQEKFFLGWFRRATEV